MAPSAAPFEPSYTALKNLRQKVHKHTTTASVNLTLPIRPQDLSTDVNPYIDDALGMLSDSTSHLYDEDAPWAVRVMEVKKGVERVDAKVDEVKTEVAEIKTEVAEIKTEVAEIKTEVAEIKTEVTMIKTGMRLLEERLESQMEIRQEVLEKQIDMVKFEIDSVRSGVDNGMAIQLNSFRKWLEDPIQPITALVLTEDSSRYTVAEGFPTTVRDFWRLSSNKPTLIRLAKHYSVVGWEWWRRSSSYDSVATSYDSIESAVNDYPSKCLRALAMSWGLQYTALERLGGPLRQEGRVGGPFRQEGRLGKRKADIDNGSR